MKKHKITFRKRQKTHTPFLTTDRHVVRNNIINCLRDNKISATLNEMTLTFKDSEDLCLFLLLFKFNIDLVEYEIHE